VVVLPGFGEQIHQLLLGKASGGVAGVNDLDQRVVALHVVHSKYLHDRRLGSPDHCVDFLCMFAGGD
jgi:hypothetical protein